MRTIKIKEEIYKQLESLAKTTHTDIGGIIENLILGPDALVQEFMSKAGQNLPEKPKMPSPEVRLHRCRLTLEEAVFEKMILGFGVDVLVEGIPMSKNNTKLTVRGPGDLVELIDGAADTFVVNSGDFWACGVDPAPIIHAVNLNNLKKFEIPTCCGQPAIFEQIGRWKCQICFGEITGAYLNEHGKWIKPSNHKGPDIAGLLEAQK